MYSVAATVAALVQLVLSSVLYFGFSGRPFFDISLTGSLISVLVISYSYFFLFYYADRVDNGIRFGFRTIPMMIGGFFANAIVGFFNQVFGLIRCRDQQHWVKTEHCIHAEIAKPGHAA